MSVYITISRAEAEALAAVLSGGLSLRLLADVGLTNLQGRLSAEFEDVRLNGATRLDRTYASEAAKVSDYSRSEDIYITTD